MVGMKVTRRACAVVLAALAVAGNASAEEPKLGYALTLTGSSDYMFRGISYTDNSPTVNMYNELNYGMFYAAFWTSTLDSSIYGPWEQDIYLGVRPVTGPINWDISANYYFYGNRDHGKFGDVSDLAFFEFKVGATTSPIANLTLGANAWLTPDQGYATTKNVSLEGTAAYALPKIGDFSPTASGLIGWSDSGTNQYYPTGYWLGQQSYTYWNAGLKVDVEKFFMDFRYWDTTIESEYADSRFVFSAGVNLMP